MRRGYFAPKGANTLLYNPRSINIRLLRSLLPGGRPVSKLLS